MKSCNKSNIEEILKIILSFCVDDFDYRKILYLISKLLNIFNLLITENDFKSFVVAVKFWNLLTMR